MGDTQTWQDKVAKLRALPTRTEDVWFPDPDAVAALEEATMESLRLRTDLRATGKAAGLAGADLDEHITSNPDYQALLAKVDELQTAEQEARTTFTFRTIPPDVYDQFELGHPPTAEQAEKNMTYNPDTYIPAMIAACSADGLTVEAIDSLIDDAVVNQGDLGRMIEACRAVNERARLSAGKGLRLT